MTKRLDLYISLLLLLLTAAVYWPLTHHEFINYDDHLYVTDNPVVQDGLTWEGVRWALTSTHASNWHPVTWVSHMLDGSLFFLYPGGHHLTNLLFHLANTVLLFQFLKRLSGARWRCALVAALFAWHPLHVESVAWVAERKDVLSTFFLILSLWAYVCYAERPGTRRYLLALGLFALGLMSKPMLVTVPCLLLLLDFWPLRRFGRGDGGLWPSSATAGSSSSGVVGDSVTSDLRSVAAPGDGRTPLNARAGEKTEQYRAALPRLYPGAVLLEKIPFFALSFASCV